MLKALQLISRKIWKTEKFRNFHTADDRAKLCDTNWRNFFSIPYFFFVKLQTPQLIRIYSTWFWWHFLIEHYSECDRLTCKFFCTLILLTLYKILPIHNSKAALDIWALNSKCCHHQNYTIFEKKRFNGKKAKINFTINSPICVQSSK